MIHFLVTCIHILLVKYSTWSNFDPKYAKQKKYFQDQRRSSPLKPSPHLSCSNLNPAPLLSSSISKPPPLLSSSIPKPASLLSRSSPKPVLLLSSSIQKPPPVSEG